MYKRIFFVFFMGLIFVNQVLAESRWHSSKVKILYPASDGSFVIRFEHDSTYCTSSSSPHYYYVREGENGVSTEGVKNMLAVAMSAAALRKVVTINYQDNDSNCYINRLFVNYSE